MLRSFMNQRIDGAGIFLSPDGSVKPLMKTLLSNQRRIVAVETQSSSAACEIVRIPFDGCEELLSDISTGKIAILR